MEKDNTVLIYGKTELPADDCKVKFNEAKVTWTAEQTPNGAEKAGDILSTINPMANCQTDVTAFIKAMNFS